MKGRSRAGVALRVPKCVNLSPDPCHRGGGGEKSALSVFRIRGGRPLHGRVRVAGRKNAAVAVIPAALMAETPSTLLNLPEIGDVKTYVEILRALGAEVEEGGGVLRVGANGLARTRAPDVLARRMRASYYLLGALLARYGRVEVPFPGGCDIGSRPVDQHIKGLRALGAQVEIEHGVIRATAKKLRGASVYLDTVSVGATINIMLAAALAEGTTVIENAARESHVVDVANYLNAMGGRVSGAGTDVIKIHGVSRLKGAEHTVIPDEIEAATYMIAGAATGGEVTVENVIPKHLEPVSAKLREAGMEVRENGDTVTVRGTGRPRAVHIKTLPYPGFPTDAQQPMSALLAIAEGTSTVTETIWDGRFKHVDELKRMGTNIRMEGRTAIIEGVERLTGAAVHASDLRAGAALVIAGLVAAGETAISGCAHIDRGYERMDEKLRSLGADIVRTEE